MELFPQLEIPTTESELEMFDVEKLRRLLPRAGEATEQTQLDIILRAIQYIQALQQDLADKKRIG